MSCGTRFPLIMVHLIKLFCSDILSVPRIIWRYTGKNVVCPLVGNDLVPLDKCQDCKYFMYRDLFHIFCSYELDKMFPQGWELISKAPARIKTKDGKVYEFVSNGKKMNFTGEWRELK